MARKRNHTSSAIIAALLSILLLFGEDVSAGPVAGPRQASDSAGASGETSKPDSKNSQTDANVKTATPDELVSSYLDALKSHILPDMRNLNIDNTGQISIDGLQGWSLDDIKAAMDAAALGLDDTKGTTQLSENGPSSLTVSVDDLYSFNTGYYFVIESDSQDETANLVSGPNLPEIIGQAALTEIDLDIVNLSGADFMQKMEAGVGMLSDSFFISFSASSSGRSIGGRNFRGGAGILGGGLNSVGNTKPEAITLGSLISQTIQFLKENSIIIAFVILVVAGIGYVTSRFA